MGVKKSEGWWGVEKRRSQRRVAVQTALCASLAELADKPRAAGRPRLRARAFCSCFVFGRPVFAFLLLAGAIDDDSSPLVVALCAAPGATVSSDGIRRLRRRTVSERRREQRGPRPGVPEGPSCASVVVADDVEAAAAA